jgi:hypothetical protein
MTSSRRNRLGTSYRAHVAPLGRRRRRQGEPDMAGEAAFCWTLIEGVDEMTRTPPAAGSSVDAAATSAPDGARRRRPSGSRRRGGMSLLWWVFLTNGLVLVIALLLLAFSPITIDAPIETGQFAVLFAGFVVLVGVNL